MTANKKGYIIVSGGAGFIGSHIASRLDREGSKVVILDNLSTGRMQNIPRRAEFIKINLEREKEYKRLDKVDCKAVFHLAGQSSGEASFDDPLYDLKSHVMSTFLLLKWCGERRISRFVYASSMSVYGDPEYLPVDEKHPAKPKTFYASGKLAAEAYVKLYQTLGIDTTIFRIFSVYGPGQNMNNMKQGMMSIYLSHILEGRPLIVKGSGERFRDFTYIDDIVSAWILCLRKASSRGNTYNLGSGRRTKVRRLVDMLKREFAREKHPVKYTTGTPGDQFGMVADISRIKRDLGWQPKTGLSEGIAKTVNFEKRRLKIEKRPQMPVV